MKDNIVIIGSGNIGSTIAAKIPHNSNVIVVNDVNEIEHSRTFENPPLLFSKTRCDLDFSYPVFKKRTKNNRKKHKRKKAINGKR